MVFTTLAINPTSISHGWLRSSFRTTTTRLCTVFAAISRSQTTDFWNNTKRIPMPIGFALNVASTLAASTRGESTTLKVANTIIAGNAIAFLNSTSRHYNIWRPSTEPSRAASKRDFPLHRLAVVSTSYVETVKFQARPPSTRSLRPTAVNTAHNFLYNSPASSTEDWDESGYSPPLNPLIQSQRPPIVVPVTFSIRQPLRRCRG